MNDALQIERSGAVLTLWLNRPELHNAFDAGLIARLTAALEAAGRDDAVRAVVVAGHGASVSAGAAARFGLTESRLGLLPAVISPYVIEAIGPRQARRWFATGEHFDADTALRIGLVHQLVEPERLDEAVQRQLALLDKAGPIASSSAKQLVRQVRDSHDRDALDRDNAALIARLRVSAEGQEGLGAFLDKRAPHWVTEA